MPKIKEHNILINLSLWANKRKAINKMVILGFEYHLFLFPYSYLHKALCSLP